jgi:O-succinylbenzoic acid--CoA ligase
MHVEAWLTRAAARHPGRPAVNALSYAHLDEAATSAARALHARGVRPGDRVGIALPAGEPFVVALHAIHRLGAAAVPLDLRLSGDERALQGASCATVVDGPLEPAGEDDAPLQATHDLDATAAVIHTSGTSGAPKAVELTFGNLLWSALGSATALGLDPGERWLCALPLSHVGGLSIVVRSAIYATTAIVHERFETDRVLRELEADDGPTLVSVVPTTLQRLLDAGLTRPPALRWALTGGGPIPPALLDRAEAAGVPVASTYGLTEACSQVTTLGPPLFCTTVETAADGEILVSGPTVAPGATAADGRLHTGDLGSLDERGHLTITGRKADTIISGGENVAPTEVEAVLEAHPAVAEAGVHARPDPEWGEAVVATVVLRAGGRATEDELRDHVAARLARYKVPKAIAFAEALPRTRSGKLLRRAL